MTPTKLLIGQIVVVVGIVIAGIWFATEWAAWRLAWQPELGLPWFMVAHWPVYRPWSIFPWWYHFDAYLVGSRLSIGPQRKSIGGYVRERISIGRMNELVGTRWLSSTQPPRA